MRTSLRADFGVDLITFFHPTFWSAHTWQEVEERVVQDPRAFWDRILDSAVDAGVHQLELTFPPGDHLTVDRAYGTTDGFRTALRERGLAVCSHYFSGLERADDPHDPAAQRSILDDAAAHADFLAALGASFLVVGLPMRRSRDADPPSFVDLAAAAPLADLLNRIGAATLSRGITTLLHTESHSMLWTPRDVDLFMLLTDPLYVGLCPDTGHLALAGADPARVAHRHADRIRLAHWKDATGPVPPGMTIDEGIYERQGGYFRPAGEGVVNWRAWADKLASFGYDGPILLEIDTSEQPVEVIRAAREFLTANVL